MKTTIDINDLKSIKKVAIDLDMTVKDLVNIALKCYLSKKRKR